MPVPKAPTLYPGNNGTVSGSTYCQGAWGSANGKAKNLKCAGGMNVATQAAVGCNDALARGNYSFFCTPTPLAAYPGNNGTVSGSTYCQGAWGSADRKAKNLKCVSGVNTATQATVGCNEALKRGDYTFFCT